MGQTAVIPSEGTNLGVFVPIWLVLPGCEATALGVFDLAMHNACKYSSGKNKGT